MGMNAHIIACPSVLLHVRVRVCESVCVCERESVWKCVCLWERERVSIAVSVQKSGSKVFFSLSSQPNKKRIERNFEFRDNSYFGGKKSVLVWLASKSRSRFFGLVYGTRISAWTWFWGNSSSWGTWTLFSSVLDGDMPRFSWIQVRIPLGSGLFIKYSFFLLSPINEDLLRSKWLTSKLNVLRYQV